MDKATSRPRGHWTPEEDERLRQLVEQNGAQNWKFIAEKLEGSGCRFRWINHLDPLLDSNKKRPFSEEEEERLLNAHCVHGNEWALERCRLCGKKRRFHNFISSTHHLTKPSTNEEAAGTINSGICKEIGAGAGESSAGLQNLRVINSDNEEPDDTMHKKVGFIDFLGVGN